MTSAVEARVEQAINGFTELAARAEQLVLQAEAANLSTEVLLRLTLEAVNRNLQAVLAGEPNDFPFASWTLATSDLPKDGNVSVGWVQCP